MESHNSNGNKSTQHIDAIIFDLGGVLLNIDLKKSLFAFFKSDHLGEINRYMGARMKQELFLQPNLESFIVHIMDSICLSMNLIKHGIRFFLISLLID